MREEVKINRISPQLDDEQRMQTVRWVMSRLEAAGGTVLMVGGFVRDTAMRLPGGDIDLATDLDLQKVATLFALYDIGRNKAFNIAVLRCGSYSFEISRFRGETLIDLQGRPIQSEISATFFEDACRRDFTINAMAMDARGNIIDSFGGMADIEAGVIRCVGKARDRMDEDPLRAIRAVRFGARFGFRIDEETAVAVRQAEPRLAMVASERISGELLKMASLPGPDFANAVRIMADLGLLLHVLPEVEALRGLAHNPQHHPEGGVFPHVLAAISAYTGQDPVVNLAILFHDLGKAATIGDKDGQPTYYGHDKAGGEIIKLMAERLRFARDLTEKLVFAAERHMQAMRLDTMRPAKVRNMVCDINWPILQDVARADCASKGDSHAVFELERIFSEAEASSVQLGTVPVIRGNRVMTLTGLQPGPAIGKIIKEVNEWSLDNNIHDTQAIEAKAMELAQQFSR
jgi:tRNA nucleotidyltransferase/poly(A) polymerase